MCSESVKLCELCLVKESLLLAMLLTDNTQSCEAESGNWNMTQQLLEFHYAGNFITSKPFDFKSDRLMQTKGNT